MMPIVAVTMVVVAGLCKVYCTALRILVRTGIAWSKICVGTWKAVEAEERLESRWRHHRQCMRTRGKGMAAHLVGAVDSDAGSRILEASKRRGKRAVSMKGAQDCPVGK
jgi:hypothetical protein